MKSVTALFRLTKLTAALVFALPLYGNAATLPGSNELSTREYNDFVVYSLQLLDACSATDARCQPYAPMSGASGQIRDYIRIIEGQPNTDNADWDFVDNPFYGPSGNSQSTWQMTGTEPDPGFAGDRNGSWEIRVDTLLDYLGGNDLVFLFNNNQRGNDEQNWLQFWGQARLYDTSGNEQACFELSNSTNPGCMDGVPDLPTGPFDNSSPYITVFTAFCVNKDTAEVFDLGLASNTNYCQQRNAWYVSGNLGNAADNAGYSQGLSYCQIWCLASRIKRPSDRFSSPRFRL